MVSDTPEKRMELLRQGQLLAGKNMTYGSWGNSIKVNEDKSYIHTCRNFLFRTVICILLYVMFYLEDENTLWREQALEALSESYIEEDSTVVFEFLQEQLKDTGLL